MTPSTKPTNWLDIVEIIQNKGLTFKKIYAIIFEVMRDKMTYKLSWKDEDTNRVSSKEFTGQDGVDHSAFNDAFAMASVVDGNLWPWVIERDGEQIAHGWGGDQLNRGRLFPTCG